MFNQKVNHYTSENPSYLNTSHGVPYARAFDIHTCGSTIQKYSKQNGCNLQTWCSKNTAVESFAMRPIVNSKEYFDSIRKYLSDIVMTDSADLKTSNMANEEYQIFNDPGTEPTSSLLNSIEIEVTNKLMGVMAAGTTDIKMFNEYNPLCEGFVITDINITTYRSTTNENHYYHAIIFSAVNTTRYNTVTFKAYAYQDTTRIMTNWNKAIGEVTNSKDITPGINKVNSDVYISFIDLLNNTTCVTGQESECEFKGNSLDNYFSLSNKWLVPNSLPDDTYDNLGNYDVDGMIRITDSGPSNFEKLIKDLGF